MAKMKPPSSGVRVRMYNPGFGDCFLLAFKGPARRTVYVLIDCGVHGAFKGGSDQIRDCIADIRKATGNKIDLAVVTHEHADHVSGFYLGRHLFSGKLKNGKPDPDGGIAVEEVWFGWTEDPRSKKAKRLDKVKKLMMQGMMASPRAMNAEANDTLRTMLGFYSMDARPLAGQQGLPLGGNVLGVSTRDARDTLRDHAKKSTYHKPWEKPLTIPGVKGVRAFVLGPPEDEKFLLSPDPTGLEDEVYEGEGDGHHMRFDAEEAVVAALGAAGRVPGEAGAAPSAERYMPFSGNHRRQIDKVVARPDLYRYFHDHYGFGEDKGGGGQIRPDSAFRRIDEEWGDSADSFALKLDSATNNSSLVLAIELEKSKRVLLFPGDAQVGNWKSWHLGKWDQKNGLARGEEIDARDLLARTVLYKVGHHGSHNATLKEQGLELMTSEDLMAMIPVDEKWARARKPHEWKMPYGPMYEDLKTRTKNRIVRTDHGVLKGEGKTKRTRDKHQAEINRAWKQFPGEVTEETDLYTEVLIRDT